MTRTVRNRAGTAEDILAAHAGEMVFTSAADVRPEAIDWAWTPQGNRYIPNGSMTLLAGKGSSAKSVLATWGAARISTGTLEGTLHGTPRPVLWATLESSRAKEVVPRLIAMGADLSMVEFVEIVERSGDRHLRMFSPGHIEALRARVRDRGTAMLVLDPLLDTLESTVKTADQAEVREALRLHGQFAEDENLVTLAIVHFNKMSTVHDAVERISGSAAFSQRQRAALASAYDDERGVYVVEPVKQNWASRDQEALAFSLDEVPITDPATGKAVTDTRGQPGTTVALRWEDPSVWSVDELLAGAHKKDAHGTKLEQATDLLHELLVGGSERPRAEVMAKGEAADISEKTMERAWRRMPGRQSVSAPGKPAMWSLAFTDKDTEC